MNSSHGTKSKRQIKENKKRQHIVSKQGFTLPPRGTQHSLHDYVASVVSYVIFKTDINPVN